MSMFYFAYSVTLAFDASGMTEMTKCDGVPDELKKAIEMAVTQTVKEYVHNK